MKSIIMFSGMVTLFIASAFSQDMQYVSRQSGDTLVVKDSYEWGDNSLYLLMRSDSLAPATRVYFLKAGGAYGCTNNPQSSKTQKTIIMGPEQNLKTGSPTMPPPIIAGNITSFTGIAVSGGMTSNKDLLIKNIDLEIGNRNGSGGGWAFFNFGGSGCKLQVDNCIMEHTWWTWVGGPPAMSVIKFTNDYFVNLDGQSCRRNGGVTDFNGSATLQDALLVENCTHVNTQGTLYKFRDGYQINRAIFNHNDFIDCAGYVIMNYGDQTNFSITNNIYVNCQLQDFCPVLSKADTGEVDADGLPMGFVNLRVDSTFTANVGTHGVYVDKNLAYWDPSLADIDSTLNANSVDHSTGWVSQRIQMNSRTTGLFGNNSYPKLHNGVWLNKLPAFKNTDVLFTDQLQTLKKYAVACVDTNYGTPLASWRQAGNPEATAGNYNIADFPIPIDLSYTDSDLLTAAYGKFPIGDLGWFPTQLASWKVGEASELAQIQTAVNTGTPVTAVRSAQLPQSFGLQQNYPNPFNPSTRISYTLAKAGMVTLKVYNVLGQEVASLVNGYQNASTYNVNFNASNLASGVYMYKLSSGNEVVSKKMVLMK